MSREWDRFNLHADRIYVNAQRSTLKAQSSNWMWMAVLIGGCSQVTSFDDHRRSSQPVLDSAKIAGLRTTPLDIGVVFLNRSGYYCVPFETLGLHAADQIKRVSTSCDCVHAQVVSYFQSTKEQARGLFLAFKEYHGEDLLAEPIQLRVMLCVELTSGERHEFTLQMLLTRLVVHRHNFDVSLRLNS